MTSILIWLLMGFASMVLLAGLHKMKHGYWAIKAGHVIGCFGGVISVIAAIIIGLMEYGDYEIWSK